MPPSAQRGEIWQVDLGQVQKPRPVVILSVNYLDHERAVITYVPRTTSLRGTRFEVRHEARGLRRALSMRRELAVSRRPN